MAAAGKNPPPHIGGGYGDLRGSTGDGGDCRGIPVRPVAGQGVWWWWWVWGGGRRRLADRRGKGWGLFRVARGWPSRVMED